MKQYNYIKHSHKDVQEFDKKVSDALGIIKRRHKSKTEEKNVKNKKYQDEIIKNWKNTGFFIPPNEKEINKLIEKEIKDDERETYEDFDDININEMFDDIENDDEI